MRSIEEIDELAETLRQPTEQMKADCDTAMTAVREMMQDVDIGNAWIAHSWAGAFQAMQFFAQKEDMLHSVDILRQLQAIAQVMDRLQVPCRDICGTVARGLWSHLLTLMDLGIERHTAMGDTESAETVRKFREALQPTSFH